MLISPMIRLGTGRGARMKTPEKIKKGLKLHYTAERCKECPYTADSEFRKTCFQLVASDALAYIQQLESRLAQVERERDAAVRDLQKISFCEDCKHLGKSKKRNPCRECQENYKKKPNWQWRGVCEENTKEAASCS